ncbi:hypothetical protein CcaCcLH18_07333 [Colletotrichum camelliae]|nr:hypothetical protein CcaCcLH18_07333 [Colletotrichum camelliae]
MIFYMLPPMQLGGFPSYVFWRSGMDQAHKKAAFSVTIVMTKPPDEPKAQLRCWDEAYNELKQKDPDLVDKYEELIDLRPVLDTGTSNPGINIEEACSNRRVQMKLIAKAAMSQTDEEFSKKSKFDEAMKVVDLARDVGTSVVQNFPQAALPWAGVCAALKAQRDGMVRVITRMNWYCELDNQLSEKSSSGLLTALKQRLITLIGQTLRDTLKLNRWEESLEDIKKLDREVRHDVEYEGLAGIRSTLEELLKFAKERESQVLKEMKSSLEKLVSEQVAKRESRCMQAIRLGDPKQQKTSIEKSKGLPVEDSSKWILESHEFSTWRTANQSRVLWIHGESGKGKTMLLCGIIDFLQDSTSKDDTLSFFFCQATDPKSNSFTAVLRGIIHDLASKRPHLIQHVENAYRYAGPDAFSEEGSWINLTDILMKMAGSLTPGTTYFIIDALDECLNDRNQLLHFIAETGLSRPHIKWILSSRNWDDIQQVLGKNSRIVSLSLEENAENVSRAVHTFIEAQVNDLSEKKKYDERLTEDIKNRLTQGAGGTFLWVALVCQSLRAIPQGRVWAQKELAESPPGLNELYGNMIKRIKKNEHAGLCLKLLASTVLVYRPITLQEMVTCLDLGTNLTKYANTNEELVEAFKPVLDICCSFLTVRDNFVHFVHQSAKDYLLVSEGNLLFPSGQSEVHRGMFRQSLESIDCEILHKDIYEMETDLSFSGFEIDVRAVKRPSPDPLSAISYPCTYWMEHLISSMPTDDEKIEDLEDGGRVHDFLKKKYIYWLEALSLLGAIPEGFRSMMNLVVVVQIYASALLFSPTKSLVKEQFEKDVPSWISLHSGVGDQWSPCGVKLQSPDLSGSSWPTRAEYMLWDRVSYRHANSVKLNLMEDDTPSCVVFSNDDQHIAVRTLEGDVFVVNIITSICHPKFHLSILQIGRVGEMSFSECDKELVIAGYSIGRWHIADRKWQVLPFPEEHNFRALARNGKSWISGKSYGNSNHPFSVRDTATGKVVTTKDSWPVSEDDEIVRAVFSPDGSLVARCTGLVQIWDITTGVIVQTIDEKVDCVGFSHDNRLLARGTKSNKTGTTITVMEVASGKLVRTWKLYDFGLVEQLLFFQDGKQLVSKMNHGTVRVFDMWDSWEPQETVIQSREPGSVFVSQNEDLVAWKSGNVLETLRPHSLERLNRRILSSDADPSQELSPAQLTPDGHIVSLRDSNGFVKVFETKSGKCIRTLSKPVEKYSVSSDGLLVATIHSVPDSTRVVTVWCVSSGTQLHTFTTLNRDENHLSTFFTPNRTHIACAGQEYLQVWSILTGGLAFSIEWTKSHFEGRDYCNRLDFDFFNHRDCLILSSNGSPPNIRSLTESQHGELVRLPLEKEFPWYTRISKDDKLLVMAFTLSDEVWIWDLTSNTCRQRLNKRDYYFSRPTFHESNLGLITDDGDIALELDAKSSTGEDVQPPQFSGIGLPVGNNWVTWKGQNVLMLPLEYQPASVNHSCKGRLAAFSSKSGQLVVLQLKL